MLIAAMAFTILELNGYINHIPSENGNEILRIAQVVGAFGSIALSFGLLILYGRQTAVLEQQYQPYLTGEIDIKNLVMSQFTVRNTGSDFAYEIEAEWAVDGDEKVWKKQSLAPESTVSFPIFIDENGRWMMSSEQIGQHIEENNIDSIIEYEIRCEDQFQIPRSFTGSVDLEVISKREDSNEIWDADPIQSLSNSASNIEASIDAIASDVDDRRDEQEWQDRWSQQQAILDVVEDRKEISLRVLGRIIDTNTSSLEYRLSELDEAGYLNFDERNGMVRLESKSNKNHTLSDFP